MFEYFTNNPVRRFFGQGRFKIYCYPFWRLTIVALESGWRSTYIKIQREIFIEVIFLMTKGYAARF